MPQRQWTTSDVFTGLIANGLGNRVGELLGGPDGKHMMTVIDLIVVFANMPADEHGNVDASLETGIITRPVCGHHVAWVRIVDPVGRIVYGALGECEIDHQTAYNTAKFINTTVSELIRALPGMNVTRIENQVPGMN